THRSPSVEKLEREQSVEIVDSTEGKDSYLTLTHRVPSNHKEWNERRVRCYKCHEGKARVNGAQVPSIVPPTFRKSGE
ncbi:hypothetical protein KAJ77_08070, partial [bacterium]|nr:hypothetical protein [bacterium]